MAIDLVKEFAKYEKTISKYCLDRVRYYADSQCKKRLVKRIKRLSASWDMVVSGNDSGNSQNYTAQMSYGLVKQQQLTRRAIFSNNFRSDPLFSCRAIGNTPQDNAINMQDILQANNEQIHFRNLVLMPGNSQVAKIGSAVIYTEYCHNKKFGWRTVADPVYNARRVYGPIKNTHNAVCYPIDIQNYFQNPDIVDCDDSDYRGHIERWTLSKLANKIKSNQELYIKENIVEVMRQVLKQNNMSEFFTDPQGRSNAHDYGAVTINDIIRGQFQIHIEGNEDDDTYYYVEMIGDTIIRFQDNPYDMDMSQYSTICCERRDEFWWGNTPAEYSIGNENTLNLLLGIGLENAIDSLKKYIFYNKNAISPALFNQFANGGRIPVDANKDINLNNLLYTYQIPDTAGQQVGDAYARVLENDQRFSTTPDLNRPTSSGGPSNKTATAANIMTNKGDTQDADLLERLSFDWMKVGEKEVIILAQFLGNFGPIMIKPAQQEAARFVRKENIVGNISLAMDTALQQSYQGELLRYQNIVSWLLNVKNGGAAINPNFIPLARQVLKMGKFLKIDEVLPEQQTQQIPGTVPTAPVPGMEQAGPAQELNPQPEPQGVMV
jgi:hypothetical protein